MIRDEPRVSARIGCFGLTEAGKKTPKEKEPAEEGGSERAWDERLEKEWETCRGVLSQFDERIHDLRKVGFTFLTALIGAEAFLIPTVSKLTATNMSTSVASTTAETSVTALSPGVRLSIVAGTILLIVTLRIIEKNYELFQRAASTRAVIIERHLDMELSEVISDKYKRGHITWLVTGAYSGFAGSVGILGVSVLQGSPLESRYVMLVTIGAILVMVMISRLGLRYPHGYVDWALGPTEIWEGESLRVTVTNLAPAIRYEKDEAREKAQWNPLGLTYYLQRSGRSLRRQYATLKRLTWDGLFGSREETIIFSKGDVAFDIVRQDDTVVSSVKPDANIHIVGQESYTWVWPLEGEHVVAGVYQLAPRGGRKPLRRKVIVRKRDDKPTQGTGFRVYVDAKILGIQEVTLPRRTLVGYVVDGREDELRGVQEVSAEETDEAEMSAVLFAIRELKGKLGEFTIVCDHESVVSEINRGESRPRSRPVLSEILQECRANPSIKVEFLASNPAHRLLNRYLSEQLKAPDES